MLNPRPARLPPKSPFPAVPPGYGPAAPHRLHQRRSSESFLIEEPPSWLDDLLDEPETPVRRPLHRRASSDSFACYEGGAWEAFPAREPEAAVQDLKGSPETKPEADTKRAKQQFAQRSRVRKLQYIAELERHVQTLHAKGLEVSAELEFLDQQNLILNLENKTLKQRLDSLVQAQHIKHLQQEVLEREISRLKLQYQQQQLQQKQQAAPTHVRRNSRDLDFQFANLSLNHKEANSLKYKEANSARDTFAGSLYI